MFTTLFTRRSHNAFAGLLSMVALAAVVFYVGAPSAAIAARMSVLYERVSRTQVEGVLKAPSGRPDTRGRVRAVFLNDRGRVIERVWVKVDRRGRFDVAAPTRARQVALTAYLRAGERAPHGTKTLTVVPGKALAVVVVFHHVGNSILPAVFPY